MVESAATSAGLSAKGLAALLYAALGLAVVACHWIRQGICTCGKGALCDSPGKHPLWHRDDLPHGQHSATTDPAIIAMWWRRWPNANIGIPCTTSKLIAFDVDPRHNGDESWHRLAAALGQPITETWTNLTGGGGQHFIFKLPDGVEVSGTNGVLGPGIDIQTNKLIMVPPSDHQSGRRYSWEIGAGPEDGALAVLPDTLVARLNGGAGEIVARGGAAPIPEHIGEGMRNITLASLAGSMRQRGLDSGVIDSALQIVNDARCEPPLPAQEVTQIATSIGRYDAPTIANEATTPTVSALMRPVVNRQHPWPDLHPEAFYGLAGDIVRVIEPATEADPAALLVRTLLTFGSVAGRGPHAIVEADRHGLNEFAVVAGETSKARKDTARGRVDALFAGIASDWALGCQVSGMSSGEGLIFAVRDAVEKQEPIREKGRPTGNYQTVIVDPGVLDKRLMVNESEFSRVLKVVTRDANTLSAILRDSWDGRTLRVMTRNSPLVATDPHISICANITRDELRRYMTETEIAGGTGNRFLFVCARRSKVLPEGGGPVELGDVLSGLVKAVVWVREKERLFVRETAARALWADEYPKLSEGGYGLYGAATNRAEAHVLRLSCIYAALDRTVEVRPAHLRAALALWRYCDASARYIFGDAVGDPVADRILDALGQTPGGLTRTDIHALFGRNLPVGRIDAALGVLLSSGRVVRVQLLGEHGRPIEIWRLVELPARYENNEINESNSAEAPIS